MSTGNLYEWLQSPLGKYVLEREQQYLDEAVVDIFGFNAMQLGLGQCAFLRTSRIPLRFTVAPDGGANISALGEELPIATQSMDLVVLPHVLEFAAEPHQILREVDRVMMPEGRVIITGFNPWSLWGLRQALDLSRRDYPWCGTFISLVRMKDWLALLGFDVSAGKLGCYIPPVRSEKWRRRFGFMEPAGDRWWGVAGGVYMLQAIKRVRGMRLIMPKWETRAAEKAMAPLTGKAAGMMRGEGAADNVIELRGKK